MNETIGIQLVQLVHRNSRRTWLPAVFAISFISYFLSINTQGYLWLVWAVISIQVFALRPLAMSFLDSEIALSVRRKLIAISLYSFLGGSAMGSSVLFFSQLDTTERLLVTLQLAGFGAGGSASNAGYTPFFLCFITPLLVPLGIFWMVAPNSDFRYLISFLTGALILLMVAVLATLGRDTFNTFSAYVELSEKQAVMSDELSHAFERAESSNRSKTRFLAAASHDLRQPVHVVSLYCSALHTMVKEPRISEVVDDMTSAIELLSSQLNSLLDVSKLDSGCVIPEFKVLNLQRLVNNVFEEFNEEAEVKSLTLVNQVDSAIHVRSDSTMLMQILRNVVGNAVKYTSVGRVKVSTMVDETNVTLMCEDTGIGIAAGEIPHVLEEFYQVNNPERNKAKGLGLGLSIVDRLATCLSHDLAIASTPGTGTRVTLCLELVQKHTHLEKPDSRQATAADSPNASLDYWVHIVDDEPMVRKSMALLIRELGCHATSTSTTEETEQFFSTILPDIIISDLRLRGEDSGFETLRAIRAMDPNIHRVIVTGETFVDANESELELCDRILYKPVSKEKLMELLESIAKSNLSKGVHEFKPVEAGAESDE